MTINKVLGAALISLPFIAFVAFMIYQSGWKAAAGVLGGTVLIVLCISAGCWLFNG